jgi:hypothetical protein
MGGLNFAAIRVGDGTGTHQTNVAAAGKIAIPTMEGGGAPKYVYVAALGGTDTNVISVSPTQDTNGAIASGFPLSPIGPPVILNVHGYSHIGYEDSGAGDSAIHLVPLEDF